MNTSPAFLCVSTYAYLGTEGGTGHVQLLTEEKSCVAGGRGQMIHRNGKGCPAYIRSLPHLKQ